MLVKDGNDCVPTIFKVAFSAIDKLVPVNVFSFKLKTPFVISRAETEVDSFVSNTSLIGAVPVFAIVILAPDVGNPVPVNWSSIPVYW